MLSTEETLKTTFCDYWEKHVFLALFCSALHYLHALVEKNNVLTT